MTVSWAIVGASRGLGLAFVSHLLENKDNIVYATARSVPAATQLHECKGGDRLKLLSYDVTVEESIVVGLPIWSLRLGLLKQC